MDLILLVKVLVLQEIGRVDGQDPRVVPWMVEQRMVMDVLDRVLEDVVVETRRRMTVVPGEFRRVQNVFHAELERPVLLLLLLLLLVRVVVVLRSDRRRVLLDRSGRD